jgi:hypothetical protein
VALVSVVCVGEDGWTETESSLLTERTTTAAAFHKEWWRSVLFFHRDGHCYRVASAVPVQRLTPLSKVLANTFYNPKLTVRYDYRSTGPYELLELCQALINAIDKDDDILTQFHEGDELKRRLKLARSFEDVVDVLDFAASDTAA